MRHTQFRRASAAGCIAVAVSLAACGSSPASAPTTSAAPAVHATTTTVPTSSTSTVPTTSISTSTIPAQSLSIAAFYSPTMNINCELPQATIPDVFCETGTPPRTVVMTPDGALTQGTSIGNAGLGTPVLPYGSSTTVAPFTCRSEPDGVTCTTTGGKGFTIAQSGITPIG